MKHIVASLFMLAALWPLAAFAQDAPPPPPTETTPVAPDAVTPPTEQPTGQPTETSPYDAYGNYRPPCDGQVPYLYDPWVEAQIGQMLRLTIEPNNREYMHCWKNLVIEVAGLPQGADYKWYPTRNQGEIVWRPTLDDVGNNEIIVRIKFDGDDWREIPYNLRVTDEWETFWMPGIGYAAFFPANSGLYGVLHGASVEYLIAGWIHRNDNRGPSHGRVYFDIDLLQSTEGLDPALAYHFGLNLSIERNPRRRFWIPFFGVETGGFYHKTTGNVFQATPLAGLHLWSDQNLFVNVTGGYLFPFAHLEELRGWRAKVNMNLSFW